MLWFVFGLLFSLFQALFSELNRIFKIDSWQLNFLHCTFAFSFFLMLIPFMELSTEPIFYVSALIVAIVMAVGCQAQIYMSSKFNGRVSSMWMPVSIFVSFTIWIALFPETTKPYMENPVILAGIVAAFALNIFSIVLIRRNDIAMRVFLLMAPIGVLYAINNVLVKYILPENNAIPQAIFFAFLAYGFMALFSFLALIAKKKLERKLFDFQVIKVGVMIGFSSALAYLFMIISLSMVLNPAFTAILGALVPVWIMIYHRFRGIKDNASPLAGTAMVISAAILIYVTA